MLLIAVGLMWWSAQGTPSSPKLALLVHAGRQSLTPNAEIPARANAKGAEAMALAPAAARGGVALRQELLQAARDGKLPPPPAVDLDLTLVNNGNRPVTIHIGAAVPTLSLEVHGDGVLRLPAPAAQIPAFLRPQTFRLQPGERHVFHIDRLVAGSAGALEYVYLTQPGEYAVTARLRLTADGEPVTVTGPAVSFDVTNAGR